MNNRINRFNIFANLKLNILNYVLVKVSKEYLTFEKLEIYFKCSSITNGNLSIFNR